MKKLILTLAFLFLAFMLTADDVITLVSDPYPPYVMDDANMKGFVTDIAIRAYEVMGYKAVYKNIPFKRAITEVKDGVYSGVLAIGKGGREEFIYPESSFGVFKNVFFKLPKTKWMWKNDYNDLTQIVFGFISGYEIGGDGMTNYIEKYKNDETKVQLVPSDNGLETNLKKLVAGRIDVLIDDSMVVKYTANLLGYSTKIVEAGELIVESEDSSPVSIGFSKNNPKAAEYIKILDEGIKKLIKSGEYKKILAKYGLN